MADTSIQQYGSRLLCPPPALRAGVPMKRQDRGAAGRSRGHSEGASGDFALRRPSGHSGERKGTGTHSPGWSSVPVVDSDQCRAQA